MSSNQLRRFHERLHDFAKSFCDGFVHGMRGEPEGTVAYRRYLGAVEGIAWQRMLSSLERGEDFDPEAIFEEEFREFVANAEGRFQIAA